MSKIEKLLCDGPLKDGAVSISLVANAWECPFEGIELSRVEVEKACEIRCDKGLDFSRKIGRSKVYST